MTDSDQNGSIAIMKHEMIAYAVGETWQKRAVCSVSIIEMMAHGVIRSS